MDGVTSASDCVTRDLRSRVRALLEGGLAAEPRPLFSGAVAQIALRGQVLEPVFAGHLASYADPQTPVRLADRVPVTADSVFDIASATKLFTAVVAIRVLGGSGIALDDPVGNVLPAYRSGPKAIVTWRHLLTHTSGLPPVCDVWRVPATAAERTDLVLAVPLVAPPGLLHAYSCVGYITAGVALSRLAGRPLDELVAEHVMTPLGLTDTGFRPGRGVRGRIASTEYLRDPPRGMVCGQVHDETAWSLGGVSANAGLFSTAADLVRLGLALCDTGPSALLDEGQHALATRDQLPPEVAAPYRQAIGPRIGDPGSTRDLPTWVGHTGFTGTSLIADPVTSTVAVLLTNRVHPLRTWSDIGELRRDLSQSAAIAASQLTPTSTVSPVGYLRGAQQPQHDGRRRR